MVNMDPGRPRCRCSQSYEVSSLCTMYQNFGKMLDNLKQTGLGYDDLNGSGQSSIDAYHKISCFSIMAVSQDRQILWSETYEYSDEMIEKNEGSNSS